MILESDEETYGKIEAVSDQKKMELIYTLKHLTYLAGLDVTENNYFGLGNVIKFGMSM